jgi:hypothetical protein
VQRGVDVDPLHGDAGLAGLVVGEPGDPLGGPAQVRLGGPVGRDEHCGVAAQLERDVLGRRRRLDAPADRTGPGEADDGQPRVGDQVRHPVVRDGQHRPGAVRQVGLGQQLAEQQR